MPAEAASADVVGAVVMQPFSQNAKTSSTVDFRDPHRAFADASSHNANMDGSKNGGPNHLRAWRLYRKMTVEQVASDVGTSPGQLSDLENDNRGLSAKWLRRLAPVLKTTPGHLLDHDPFDLPTGIAEAWFSATEEQRKQLVAMAAVVVPSTGTEG